MMPKLKVVIELEDQREIDAMYRSMETIFNQPVCWNGQRTLARQIMTLLEPMVREREQDL